jgi:hypothetical protein
MTHCNWVNFNAVVAILFDQGIVIDCFNVMFMHMTKFHEDQTWLKLTYMG